MDWGTKGRRQQGRLRGYRGGILIKLHCIPLDSSFGGEFHPDSCCGSAMICREAHRMTYIYIKKKSRYILKSRVDIVAMSLKIQDSRRRRFQTKKSCCFFCVVCCSPMTISWPLRSLWAICTEKGPTASFFCTCLSSGLLADSLIPQQDFQNGEQMSLATPLQSVVLLFCSCSATQSVSVNIGKVGIECVRLSHSGIPRRRCHVLKLLSHLFIWAIELCRSPTCSLVLLYYQVFPFPLCGLRVNGVIVPET